MDTKTELSSYHYRGRELRMPLLGSQRSSGAPSIEVRRTSTGSDVRPRTASSDGGLY